MSRQASSPLDLGSLLLSLSLPATFRRSPELIVMDNLKVRLYETHEEVVLTRAHAETAAASVFVYPDRVVDQSLQQPAAAAACLTIEGRSAAPAITIVDDVTPDDDDDDVIRAVFGQACRAGGEEKCACRACQISAGTASAPAMEQQQGASGVRQRPIIIADMDVNEVDDDRRRSLEMLSPDSDHLEPMTPNASRSRRPSEKMDYGINWIEAFNMQLPRQRKTTMTDEIDGRLSAMEQEEAERGQMEEALHRVDEVSRGVRTPEPRRTELLFDSSITAKDIFGRSAKSDDVVFNASISLDDIFSGISRVQQTEEKARLKKETDKYYYQEDDEEEECLPPEVAALYAPRPPTTTSSSSALPQSTSVLLDDVFAALDQQMAARRQRQLPTNLDEYYADPPSEAFTDSAVSSSRGAPTTDNKTDERREQVETRSSSSGVSAGKASPPPPSSSTSAPAGADSSWLQSLVEQQQPITVARKRGSAELRLQQQQSRSGMDSSTPTTTDDEPSPPLDPATLRNSPKQTRKESYLLVGELFSTSHTSLKELHQQELIPEEEAEDWVSRLAESNTEEILDAVFAACTSTAEKGKKCGCQACDPTRSIYLEREAASSAEERKLSLHLVNPVEITLEEVFEGPRSPPMRSHEEDTTINGREEESSTVEPLPPVEIDLEVVFSTPVHSPSTRGIDSDKWQPREIVKEIKQQAAPQQRKRSATGEPPLAPSNISLGEVFKPASSLLEPEPTVTPRNTPTRGLSEDHSPDRSEPIHLSVADFHRHEERHNHHQQQPEIIITTEEISLDEVFTGTPSESAPRVDLSKFEQRTLERIKSQKPKPVMITNSSFPVIVADPLDMEQVFNPPSNRRQEDTMITNSSVPVIIAEEVTSTALEEALRSPKLETEHAMVAQCSFPVFLVEKEKEQVRSLETALPVKFGLLSRSASPEPDSNINLDQVFTGISSVYKPRVDLSKFEQRTLERNKTQKTKPVLVTNSSYPVIVTDPVDMEQVFNPSTSRVHEETMITNSSVPVIIAEEVTSSAMEEALSSPKLESPGHGMVAQCSFPVFLVDRKEWKEEDVPIVEPTDVKFGLLSSSTSPEPESHIDLDEVFSGVSTESHSRVDLSKFEQRSLENIKKPPPRRVRISNTPVPSFIPDPLDMDEVFNPSTSKPHPDVIITNSSIPVIIAEELSSSAMEDALRSPKLESPGHGMVAQCSFPVFLVDKKEEEQAPSALQPTEVKFGLLSRSASPEPESNIINLDQVFTGISSVYMPRVDLSKFEQRSLERAKRPTPKPVMVTNSSYPVIIADPLDMDQVFNPSTSHHEDLSNSSVPVIIAEKLSATAMEEALRSPKLESPGHGMVAQCSFPVFLVDKKEEPQPQAEISLDQVFAGVSTSSTPRMDLSKFEERSIEMRKRRDTPRPAAITTTSRPRISADPLDMDLVFNPTSSSSREASAHTLSESITDSIIEDAVGEAARSPLLLETTSSTSFSFEKDPSFAAIDSATALDEPVDHPVYPKKITHVRTSAPATCPSEELHEQHLKDLEEEEEEVEDEDTPLPVFSRSRNPAYGLSSDRPHVSQSEDGHIHDPISIATDLPEQSTDSIKKIISPAASQERLGPAASSSIDLDEVFAATTSSTTRSSIDLDKFVARTLERSAQSPRATIVQQEEHQERRAPELPLAPISVDDIFSPQPLVSPEPPPKPPRRLKKESEHSQTDLMDDPAAEVDLDSVFNTSFESRADNKSRAMLQSADNLDEHQPLQPVRPPRRSSTPAAAEEKLQLQQPKPRLVSTSSFPILIAESPAAEDELQLPAAPPRRPKSPLAYPGVMIVHHPPTPPAGPSPVPPARHRRTDSVSLPRSRAASFNKVIEETIEEEEGLTIEATFAPLPEPTTARPSITVTETGDGVEATVEILLPVPDEPPRLSFPPPPPDEEEEAPAATAVLEEDVKEARLMASPDFPPLSVVTAPAEIDMAAVFDSKILTPSRFDSDRFQPRTLEREKKRTVEAAVEERPKNELPESDVNIDEVFSGQLTTTEVEYVTSPTRFSLKKKPEVEEEKKETWEEDLANEIDDYERRRQRLGQEVDGSYRSTISSSSHLLSSSTPEGTWRRNESLRSAQEPVIALIEKDRMEKERKRKMSAASSKSVKSLKGSSKRPGSSGSHRVEHRLEPAASDGLVEVAPAAAAAAAGAQAEAREAKRNGKVWRVDRVQKSAIEDVDEEKGVRIQVHTIPAPLSVSLDSLDDIHRSIDDAFEEALSPRGRSIEVTPHHASASSSSLVHADVHRPDDSEPYPQPEYRSETIERSTREGRGEGRGEGVYRTTASLPSSSDTTKIVFPLTASPRSSYEEQRYVTSASIRLEKTLPTPDATMERREKEFDPSFRWIPSPEPINIPITVRKRSRSEGPLGLLEDVVMTEDSSDTRNYRMSWHPSSMRPELEDRGYRGSEEKIHGSLTTTVRVAGFSSPKSGRSREARERRKKIIRKSRHSVSSSSTSNGESSSTKPDEEEMLEVEVRRRHIILRGSYNLVVDKDEPLGQLLLSLSDDQTVVPAALDFSVLPKLRRLLRECMTRRARSVSILSSRGASLLDIPCPSFDNLKTVVSDLFHPINNPRGKVNLCTAENRVCEKEVSKRLEEVRFHPDTHRWMLRYAGTGGLRETKLSLISHFNRLLSVSIHEEEAVLLPSCTAAYDVLSHLACDPHDIILTPAPYYARIRNDCAERNECRVEPVTLDLSKPELFVSDFEREYATWASKGERVRAVILMNPHNPLGNVFTRHQMMSVCEWAISNDLFIIVDEILAGTIYSESELAEFQSMITLKNQLSKPEQLVWMGSLSKDLGIPGVRTALVVAGSPAVRDAVRRLENLSGVPAPSQLIVDQLIKDEVFLSSTLAASRHRLGAHARFVVDALKDIGVPAVLPQAGICLMADFSQFLSAPTSEEENALHRRLIEHGVVLTKGESTVAPVPGWFRIAFGVPKEELELGLRRIYSTVARDATLQRAVSYDHIQNGTKRAWLLADVRPTSPGTTVESA